MVQKPIMILERCYSKMDKNWNFYETLKETVLINKDEEYKGIESRNVRPNWGLKNPWKVSLKYEKDQYQFKQSLVIQIFGPKTHSQPRKSSTKCDYSSSFCKMLKNLLEYRNWSRCWNIFVQGESWEGPEMKSYFFSSNLRLTI